MPTIIQPGDTYWYWTVVERSTVDRRRNRLWVCRCQCGQQKTIGGHHLRSGDSKSCGCKKSQLAKEKITGSQHYSWKGGCRNRGSLAWCGIRIGSLRNDAKRRGQIDVTSTAEDLKAIWDRSGGECESCGKEFDGPRSVHVDHDHATGKIRGCLCQTCNVALGMVSDSLETLSNLSDYLVKYGAARDKELDEIMPRRSNKVGYKCPAIYDGDACGGMMTTETIRHPTRHRVRRYRVCKKCGARQRTNEQPDGAHYQPKVPIYRRKDNNEEIQKSERCLTDFFEYLHGDDD